MQFWGKKEIKMDADSDNSEKMDTNDSDKNDVIVNSGSSSSTIDESQVNINS